MKKRGFCILGNSRIRISQRLRKFAVEQFQGLVEQVKVLCKGCCQSVPLFAALGVLFLALAGRLQTPGGQRPVLCRGSRLGGQGLIGPHVPGQCGLQDRELGDEFLFEDMLLYSSSYEKPDTDLNLAWSGVGQYKDIMTPMQMCMLTAAVANDGVMMQPRLLYKVVTRNDYVRSTPGTKVYKTILSEAEAEIVQQAMLGTVEYGTGTQADVDGCTVGGKTGSAEISSDKSVKTHAWFTGFIQDEDHPLAVCVILEQAGGGGSMAAPLAGKLLAKAVELGY